MPGYIWHIPGFKDSTFDRFGFSTNGIVISASAVPHCGLTVTWLNRRRQTVSHNDVMPGPNRHNELWWRDDAVAGLLRQPNHSHFNRQLTRYLGPEACATLTPKFILTKTCRKPNPKFNRNGMIAWELCFCCVSPKMERHFWPHN